MRRWVMILTLAWLIGTGCAPKTSDEWAGLVRPDTLEKANLSYYWHNRLELVRRERLTNVFLVEDRLYCLTSRNRLLALDAVNGVWEWSRPIATKQAVFRPIHVDGVTLPAAAVSEDYAGEPFDAVMLNTLSNVLVLDRSNGKIVRQVEFDFAANTGGDSDGKYFYAASTNGWCYAINLTEGVRTWGLPTGRTISAPLRLYRDILCVGGEDNVFYAIQAGRYQRLIWSSENITSQPMLGPVTAEFYVGRRGCFVPCEDNRLYAYDRLTGRPLWEPLVCQGPLRDPVAVAQDTVFQFARQDRFYAVDRHTGKTRWDMKDARVVLAAVKGRDDQVYLLDKDGDLLIADEMTGEIILSLPMTGYDLFVQNASAPAIFAASKTGHIVCIRPKGAGALTAEILRQSDG